ncbi:hypothetical protein HYH03_000582 [Edaphochlamys debaryana]|uniref:Thioredoxin domain-containing protein n=1 Tax=Edaphochlamys debaryana TaxID=47281 RepID=A0A836C6N4_9CHLO|nr:hypothetical protein HYH03_000582 [Edaphochlamys debaryana]|eukprot:KAG2502090.1 hypothetical protein HYH03_000582 [Edaphochlamys debaryana]
MVAVTTPRELDLLAQKAMLQGRACLINFFQDDCYACRSLHTKLKKLAHDHPDVLFLKVNGSIEAMRPVFEKHGITKVPYFFCLRHGRILSRFSASLNPEKLAMLRKELVAALHATAEEEAEEQRPQHAEHAPAALELEPAVVAA